MIRLLSLFVIAVAVAGCDPYVNIPGQPGNLADDSANDLGVQEAIARSLRYAMRHDPPAGEIAVKLPEGTRSSSYSKIFMELGSGRRLEDADAASPVYDVISVQIRGTDGQVDLVPPVSMTGGVARVQSVYLRHKLLGWQAHRQKLWNMPVPDAMALANPAAAPRFADYQPPRK